MAKIILASGSPRRRELLKMIAPDYVVASGKDVDETYPAELSPELVPAFLSQLKAMPYKADLQPGDILITADTVVILDGRILGKPHSRDEAIEMLMSMQGRTHTVVTGVTLTTPDDSETFSQHTEVIFDSLSLDEVTYYVDNYRPFDKAGAYGIQEWIGAAAITGIRGSFYNVMGLPIHALYKALRSRGAV
ncbi:MAG: Maf family nucleotide pyrophosphatase [Muribaculaceae bacterium]|nr:Maf family nucleotide pyrophosphatase [Muribaculaceae bacterium]